MLCQQQSPLTRQDSQNSFKKLKCMISMTTGKRSECTRTKSNSSLCSSASNSKTKKALGSFFKKNSNSEEKLNSENHSQDDLSTSEIIAPVAPHGWQVRYDPILKQYYYVHLYDSFVQLDHPDEVVKRPIIESAPAPNQVSQPQPQHKKNNSKRSWGIFRSSSKKSVNSIDSMKSSDSISTYPSNVWEMERDDSVVSTINTIEDSAMSNPLTPLQTREYSNEIFHTTDNSEFDSNAYTYGYGYDYGYDHFENGYETDNVQAYYDDSDLDEPVSLSDNEESEIDNDSLFSFIFNGKDQFGSSYSSNDNVTDELPAEYSSDLDGLRAKMACENYLFTRERFNEA